MIPDFQDFFYPVLEYFADFERHTTKEANEYIQGLFKVNAEEAKTKLYSKRFNWTLTYFVRALVLERVEHAVYMITERGIDLFNESEGTISYNRLLQYPEFRKKEWDKRGEKKQAKDVPSEERLQELRECEWKEFEQAIASSVATLGYDSPFSYESVEEEGIKGLAFKEEEAHWIEAVQYDMLVVNGKRIKHFEEEMNEHQASQGVFMTTSRFSREVLDSCPDNIELIDGNGIVQLLEESSQNNPQINNQASKATPTNAPNHIEELKGQLSEIVSTWAREHHQAVSLILECDTGGNIAIELQMESEKISTPTSTLSSPREQELPKPVNNEPQPVGPLKVEFPDGKVIHELYGNHTLLEAIKIIGPERIVPYNLMASNIEQQVKKLIQLEPDSKLKGALKPVKPGYYLLTSSPTEYKAQLLVWISNKLNLGLKVWCEGQFITNCDSVRQVDTSSPSVIVPPTPKVVEKPRSTVANEEPHQLPTPSPTQTIKVTFSNGKTVNHPNPDDTLIVVIKKAGIEKVYRKNYYVETKDHKKVPLIGTFRDKVYFGDQKLLTVGRYLTSNLDIYTQVYILNKLSKDFKLWAKVELVESDPLPVASLPPCPPEEDKPKQEPVISDENSYLAITLPHGQMLTGDTFAEFFKYADAAKIRFTETSRTTDGLLLFKQAHPNYDRNIYVSVGCGYCVKCDYSNQEKYRIVSKINSELNLGLKVELRVSPNLIKEKKVETTPAPKEPKQEPTPNGYKPTSSIAVIKPYGQLTKDRITVHLPNGMRLAGEPFLEVIRYLDPAKVRFTTKARKMKDLIQYDPRLAFTSLKHYQEVSNGYYVRVDYTADMKYQILCDLIAELKSPLQINWVK